MEFATGIIRWPFALLRMTLVLLGSAVLLLLIVVFVSLTVPMFVLRAKLDERRTAKGLADLACPHCGTRLGEAAVRAAKTEFAARCRALWHDIRTHGFRLQMSEHYLEIRCPHCSHVTRYSPRSKLLVLDEEHP